MPSNIRRRAPNLDDKSIEQIVKILDCWSLSKLTWDLLTEQILLHHRVQYTRQALHSHIRIKGAFNDRKKALRGSDSKRLRAMTPEQQRISNLEAEVARLNREKNNLLEQFNRWVYNGYLKQMDERMRDFMNQPLPPVYREPSEKPFKARKGKGE